MKMKINPAKESLTKKGFTLIELILVVAIVTILAVSVASVGTSFLSRNDIKNNVNEVVSSLRNAQLDAMSGKGDSQWGVTVTGSNIVLFKGSSFATRDATQDIKFTIPSKISITSFEVVFDKLTGNPNATANITISDQTGESHVVSVNQVGIVDVN